MFKKSSKPLLVFCPPDQDPTLASLATVMCTGRKVGTASVSGLLDLSTEDKEQVISLL